MKTLYGYSLAQMVDTNVVTETEIESYETTSQEYQLYCIHPESSPSFYCWSLHKSSSIEYGS